MGNDEASSSFPELEAELFEQALDKTGAEREAFLQSIAASDPASHTRLKALLAAYDQSDGPLVGLPDKARPASGDISDQQADEAAGQTIGRYKLLEKIGEGGCGVVYMAEQTQPIRRRVALKLIKPGMDTRQVIARFEAERQALALMDHPNIAKVLDAGTDEKGRPYFVMELVRGVKITAFCDENRLATEERLNLFIQICRAIQHAHQQGIIHRDIKPSNILVTVSDKVPIPKVIDFGVAKAIGQQLTDKTILTAFEQFIGTPAYVSPEQAEMTSVDVDTRSDIYSLGVLLYELLTGQTPFDQKELVAAGLDEMRRVIREKEPVRPSIRLRNLTDLERTTVARRRHTEPAQLVHLVQGELDWIVMKCLEKDPATRYETANGLAEDVSRHLRDEMVTARPPSKLYRLCKWIRRKWLQGIVFSLWQAFRARRAEAQRRHVESEKARQDAEAVSKFLTGVFQSADRSRDGHAFPVTKMLDRAAKMVETELANQPEGRAQLQSALGNTCYALGLYREAASVQEKVRDYHVANSGSEHPETLRATQNLARTYEKLDRQEDAVKMLEDVVKLSAKVNGPEHPDTLSAMHRLASLYILTSRGEEALKLREQVLTLRRKVLGPEHPDTVIALHNLAMSYLNAGRTDSGLKLREEALTLLFKVLGPEHHATLVAMRYLMVGTAASHVRDIWGHGSRALPKATQMFAASAAHDLSGWVCLFEGQHDEARRAVQNLEEIKFIEEGDCLMALQQELLALGAKDQSPDHQKALMAVAILREEALKLRQEGRRSCRG